MNSLYNIMSDHDVVSSFYYNKSFLSQYADLGEFYANGILTIEFGDKPTKAIISVANYIEKFSIPEEECMIMEIINRGEEILELSSMFGVEFRKSLAILRLIFLGKIEKVIRIKNGKICVSYRKPTLGTE